MTGASFKYAAFTALSRAMRLAGVPPLPKAGQRVLLYHSVGTKLPEDPYGLSIEPKRFEEHMDRLTTAIATRSPPRRRSSRRGTSPSPSSSRPASSATALRTT
ncbi:MAG: hypothetical protein NTX64_08970 [Elusimicrobia bacterium]|nr:hypothetical protein [Elusimicrobiota bacterium]